MSVPKERTSPVEIRLAHSPDECARLAACSRTMIFAEIKEGRLKARKLGRLTRILDSDLRDWLAGLPSDRSPKAAEAARVAVAARIAKAAA